MAAAYPAGLTFLAPSFAAAPRVPLQVAGAEFAAPEAAPQPQTGATRVAAAAAAAAVTLVAVRRTREARRGPRVARRFAEDDTCGILPDVDVGPKLATPKYVDLKDSWEPTGATLDPAIAKRLGSDSQVARGEKEPYFAALGVRLNSELANSRLQLISSGVGSGSFAGARASTASKSVSGRGALVARAAKAAEDEEADESPTAPVKKKIAKEDRPSEKEDFPFDGVEEPDFDPADQIGAMAPLGFFDPAGFTKDCDKEKFRNLRAAEIKHGRVAMMASVGSVIEHYVKIPGFERAGTTFESKFLAIVSIPGVFLFPIFIIGLFLLELSVWAQDEDAEPGNFGDPFGFGMYDKTMREREINNGRMAMFAAMGIIVAQIATGKDAVQQLGIGL